MITAPLPSGSSRQARAKADALPARADRRSTAAFVIISVIAVLSLPATTMADEGGVSFWLPGLFGSLSAVPQQPGWSLAAIGYHTSVSAGGDVSRAREIQAGRIPVNVNATLNANLDASVDLALVNATYVFATPVLGGQAAVGMMGVVGQNTTSIFGTLNGTITTPFGTVPFSRSDAFSDHVTGLGDLYPTASLRWNAGVHNFMVYATGDIPVGSYDPNRLANIGIGHAAVDGGFGYTYLDPTKGHEFSALAGLTYNFTNPDTQYKNGVDFHLDWGASQFLSKQLLVGLVGYAYQQVSCDSGSGNRVGCFESRVFGVGPQIGYIVPLGEWQGYLNLKGYGEFGADNRPEGWNGWLTFAVSPAGAAPPPVRQTSQMFRK